MRIERVLSTVLMRGRLEENVVVPTSQLTNRTGPRPTFNGHMEEPIALLR